jgi:hydroxymethylbilane synthase
LSQTIRIALFPGVEEYPELVGLTRIFEQQQIASEIQLKRGNFSANSLLHGAEDAAITPLENLPVHQTEGIVIAAIIERQNPAECLVVSPKARDEAMLFKLREQAIVYTRTMRQQAQMNDFRPDVQFLEQLDEKEGMWQLLETGRLDAAILPAYTLTLAGEKFSDFHFQYFHPREFVPAPGQGALAVLACREDTAIRKILQAVHKPDISGLTNIERGCLRLAGESFNGKLGVYAERDKQDNYHVRAVVADGSGNLRRTSLSSSTNYQISERILKELGF